MPYVTIHQQVSVALTRDRVAEKLTDLSGINYYLSNSILFCCLFWRQSSYHISKGNPKAHIEMLRRISRASGAASLQNILHLGETQLSMSILSITLSISNNNAMQFFIHSYRHIEACPTVRFKGGMQKCFWLIEYVHHPLIQNRSCFGVADTHCVFFSDHMRSGWYI
jgi:hypothetical protein